MIKKRIGTFLMGFWYILIFGFLILWIYLAVRGAINLVKEMGLM